MEDFKKTEEELKKIKEEVLGCKKCSLYKIRTCPVIGEGNHRAKIIFVGEAPGAHEDKTGRPFCGAAGKVLDEVLESIGIKRKEIYICNILKCRPPANRNPQKEEIEFCVPYLDVIKPEIICTLGNYSTAYIMEKYGLKEQIQGISKIRAKVFKTKDIKIIPLYHPAVAPYNPNMKGILKEDFKILKRI